MSRRIILGVVATVVALAVIGAVAGGRSSPTAAETAAGRTLAANIKSTLSGESWYSALMLDAAGLPLETVADHGSKAIVFVRFAPRMDHAPIAPQVCAAIAALAHDPNTAAPLPIASVVVSANGDNAAQCTP